MGFPKLPWWVGLPASLGFGLMGVFAPTFLPIWAQAAFFAVGALCVLWSFLAGIWHFAGVNARAKHAVTTYPERHRQILQSLADVLAEVQNLSLARAYWNPQTHHALRQDHFGKLADARTRAENLNEQIPYDPDTMQTVRDFLQAAQIVVHDALRGWDDRESRSDLDRIAQGLFRYLHDGKAVDRSKIDLPAWCRDGDVAAPAVQPPEPERPEMPMWKAAEHICGVVGDRDFNNCYPEARRQIRQAAIDGRLEIWGRKEIPAPLQHTPLGASGVWSKIEPDYWNEYELSPLAIGEHFERRDHTWHEAYRSKVGDRYWELKVRKADVERLWPTENT